MSAILSKQQCHEGQKQLLYGIDIGGTKIEIGIFSSTLELLGSWRTVTPTNDYEKFIATIIGLVKEANLRYNSNGTVGIGMPGIIDEGGLVKSSNVPCLTGKNVTEDLQLALGGNISIGNDGRLFALSEAIGGAGESYHKVFGAIVGTGAAGGFCLNSEIYHGKNGLAGEYGHIPVSAYLIDKFDLPLFDCGCGKKGCYEAYVSGPGLGRIYQFFGAKNHCTYDFVQALSSEEDIANRTFDCYMHLLGASFVSLILSYDPDIIVVGGGISKIDKVIEQLPDYVNKSLFSGVVCPPIKRAKYGDSSGVRGAAILRRLKFENR